MSERYHPCRGDGEGGKAAREKAAGQFPMTLHNTEVEEFSWPGRPRRRSGMTRVVEQCEGQELKLWIRGTFVNTTSIFTFHFFF